MSVGLELTSRNRNTKIPILLINWIILHLLSSLGVAINVLVQGVCSMVIVPLLLSLFAAQVAGDGSFDFARRSQNVTLCDEVVRPLGYPCSEHKIQTDDGYLLGLQRVWSSGGNLKQNHRPPVLLQHGLFMAGDVWFLNSPEESLGFILADRGFDVWIGNVRGTRWSRGHVSLSVKDKDFWDWSWQELALFDLAAMIRHINSVTNSKVYVVGHSQGTIMSLAALTQPDTAEMVEAAGLLSPISYLDHITSKIVLRMVAMHLDQMIVAMGFHQLNFRSDWGINLLDSICDDDFDCGDLLASITGGNCCFNDSRIDYYLKYEPHASSAKNLRHLFQMIRKGTFAKYDYGLFKNLVQYGQSKPPEFNLGNIPEALPIWMAYGGKDALADEIDVKHTLRDLKSTPELLYLENYGHVDFMISVTAKEDLYDHMISFFRSRGKSSSLK